MKLGGFYVVLTGILMVVIVTAGVFGFTQTRHTEAVGSVQISFIPSRTSGVAPLAVNFDATGTTSSATDKPFRELDYSWNFGDSGSGTWAESGKSRNIAKGGVSAHVFDNPGTYNVSLTVKDSMGGLSTQNTTITVLDPNTVFSGTNTRCVSTSGNFSGCPTGAEQITSSNFNEQVTWVKSASGRRLLFRRGDSWSSSSSSSVNIDGPGYIGAYGTCSGANQRGICSNAPLIQKTSGNHYIFTVGSANDWRITDLAFSGSSCEGCGGAITGWADVDNNLWYRLKSTGFDIHFGLNDFQVGTANVQNDNVFFVNNEVSSGYRYGAYLQARGLTIMGNHIGNTSVSHILRISQAHKSVISNNLLENASTNSTAGRHALKLHSYAEYASTISKTEYVVVSDNTFGGSGPWTVVVGPVNAVRDERLKEIVIERNKFIAQTPNQNSLVGLGLKISASGVIVRNNIFNATSGGLGSYTAINVSPRGIEPPPSDVGLYNNTVYRTDTNALFGLAYVDANSTNVTIKNNLGYAPLSTGALWWWLNTANSGVIESNNLLSSSPGFVNVPGRDLHYLNTSPAIDSGVTINTVFDDRDGNPRPRGNGYDLGAYESSFSATVCLESWSCTPWSTCSDGGQSRTCTDLNSCDTSMNKPAETQICGTSTCTENWSCGSWSTCSSSSQSRTCTDSNRCNTTISRPSQTQSCTLTGGSTGGDNTGTCTPTWFCFGWNTCVSNSQDRTCIDLSGCGTTSGRPDQTQTCTSTGATGDTTGTGTTTGSDNTGTCTPSWFCFPWNDCSSNSQDRTCLDLSGCGVSTGKPTETEACGSAAVSNNTPRPVLTNLSDIATVSFDPANPNYNKGALIKVENDSAVYHYTGDGKRRLFVNEKTFWSWRAGTWADHPVQTLSQADFDSLPIGENITVRPGTNLIRFQNSNIIYIPAPNNELCYAAIGYGENWQSRVVVIQNAFENDYHRNKDCVINSDNFVYPSGMVIQYENSLDFWYIDGNNKRLIDASVFINNGFKGEYVVRNVSNNIRYNIGVPLQEW